MSIITRKAHGLPVYPIIGAFGTQGAGKTHLAAQASASPLVSSTLWVGYGELSPDVYHEVPGADFDIVEHNGTVAGTIDVLEEIAALPQPDEGPVLLVFDSGSPFWNTISQNVNTESTSRAKDARGGPDNNADLWGTGKGDWQRMLNALRNHKGPSIITARMDASPIYSEGRPTKGSIYSVQGEKNLAYDVDVVIEMRERGQYLLTKGNSPRLAFKKQREWPDFTVHDLLLQLGLGESPAGPRSYATPVGNAAVSSLDTSGRAWLNDLAQCRSLAQVILLGSEATAANASADIMRAIRSRRNALSPKTPTGTPPAGQ